jgi:hypothetical protein
MKTNRKLFSRGRIILIFAFTIIALMFAAYFFIFKKQPVKTEDTNVIKFLNDFERQVKLDNVDSLTFYFQKASEIKNFKPFINILSGKKGLDGNGTPYAKISMDIDGSVIQFLNKEIIIATIPVNLNYELYPAESSSIAVRICRVSPNIYKITDVDAKWILDRYISYQSVIKKTDDTTDFKITYNKLTQEAFKSAHELKKRYDSVLWFDHVNGQNYFYVIKGSMAGLSFMRGDVMDKTKCKMGLVGPSLKEIIPVEFELIHNVGGTIDGLIEVEKDSKRGLYDIDGKLVAPVSFDQIFPLKEDNNLALLRKGDDYFYLTKVMTLTGKIADFAIAEKLPKIKGWGESYKLTDTPTKNLMEYNDRLAYNSLVIAPSYLVDLQILPQFIELQNPMRHYDNKSDVEGEADGEGDGSIYYEVKHTRPKEKGDNWFEYMFNAIMEEYLGARAGLYEGKNVLIADKKTNRLLGFQAQSYYGRAESGGALSGQCDDNSLHQIGENLFEFKTTSYLDQELFDEKMQMQEGPYYHYLQIKNKALVALKGDRIFNCTKFARMDDSYLNTCFVINNKSVDHMTPEILRYMKNEIYASYGYGFKNQRWNDLFEYRYKNVGTNQNVDDSLSVIEKHNIQWINSKLNNAQSNTFASK